MNLVRTLKSRNTLTEKKKSRGKEGNPCVGAAPHRVWTGTYEALDKEPQLAGIVIISALIDHLYEVHGKPKPLERDCIQTFLTDWIHSPPPIPLEARKRIKKLLETTDSTTHQARLAQSWMARRGRPITLRHAAIQALVRRQYLHKSWIEITKRLCPCGEAHTTDSVRLKCRPNLEATVRELKRLLRNCGVRLPASLFISAN